MSWKLVRKHLVQTEKNKVKFSNYWETITSILSFENKTISQEGTVQSGEHAWCHEDLLQQATFDKL